MFVTRILFHLKRYVRDKHSLSFKTLVKFATRILFQLKHCLQRPISFIQNVCNVRDTHSYYITLHLAITITYCSYIYNEVLSSISKINTKKIETINSCIMEKCQMLQRKILSLSNLSLFESETILS